MTFYAQKGDFCDKSYHKKKIHTPDLYVQNSTKVCTLEQHSASCTLVFHTTFIGLSIYLYYVCKDLVVIT